MNVELDEVVAQDVSDEALQLAAGGGQGVARVTFTPPHTHCGPPG
jgi:hypothetical protein